VTSGARRTGTGTRPRLDRLVELNRPAVHLEVHAPLVEAVGDVAVRHGAEQLALLARARPDDERDALELRRLAARLEILTALPLVASFFSPSTRLTFASLAGYARPCGSR
jgi:hypothetical protein